VRPLSLDCLFPVGERSAGAEEVCNLVGARKAPQLPLLTDTVYFHYRRMMEKRIVRKMGEFVAIGLDSSSPKLTLYPCT
jgi:hypothetical protein